MSEPIFEPLSGYEEYPVHTMRQRAGDFLRQMQRRRTVRQFSAREIPEDIIEDCLRTAGSAPSGANMQPWQFVLVKDKQTQRRIRVAAEEEEEEFYTRRAPLEWLEALAPLGTDASKPFLEIAPYLIAIFEQRYGLLPDGRKVKHYYAAESVGIATGMLIAALHNAGLVTLTHTPSPMNFLSEILNRPTNEKPFLLLVVGYPAKDAVVPRIVKKSLDEYVTRR